MFIEINGTEFINKGAELMLYAILSKVSKKISDAKFVHAPGRRSPYLKRAQLGLYQKIGFKAQRNPFGLCFDKFTPKKFRAYYGLIPDKKINIVLDASGFCYSDKMSSKVIIRMAKAYKAWKKNKTRIIMLPQALGPFNSKKIQKSSKIIIDNADLVYARDKVSYRYVTELVGHKTNIRIAPDFTNLISGVVPNYFTTKNKKICIIPNHHMLDKTSVQESRGYFYFLEESIKCLKEKGEDFFILIHEGKKDLFFAKKLIRSNDPVQIITEDNPLKIKGIIGNCKAVISSRFHGLVSALSQAVPSLGMGWSHKYQMLFEDYGFMEGFLSVKSDKKTIRRAIDMVTEEKVRMKIKERLCESSKKQKLLTEEMWDEVFRNFYPNQ